MTRAAATARRSGLAVLAAGALLVAGAVLSLVQQESARAAPAPAFTLQFDDLTPGVPQERTDSFVLERDAALVSFAWLEREGILADADLAITVCDAAATCLDPSTASEPVDMIAGTVDVTVATRLAATAPPGGSGSVVGQLSFVADDDLAATGANPLQWLAVGAAAVALGAVAIAASGRGRREVAGSG